MSNRYTRERGEHNNNRVSIILAGIFAAMVMTGNPRPEGVKANKTDLAVPAAPATAASAPKPKV